MLIIEKISNLPPQFLNPWVYWIVLGVSIVEPMPLIGSFFPGQSIVILAGILVKQGALDFWDLVAFAGVGSVLGDLIGFLIGKKYGDAFLTRYGRRFFLKKERLDKVKLLLQEHTGKTLVLGRFNSLTRCFSPFLAGSTGIVFRKFLVYNIVGGACWSVAFVTIGFFFGKGFEIASHFIGEFVVMGLILSGIVVFLVKLENKGRRIFHLKHRFMLIMNVVSLYLFSKMIEDVVHGQTVTKWDFWISAHIPSIRNPFLDSLMIYTTTVLKPGHLEMAALCVFLFLLFNRKWDQASFLGLGMMGGLLINHLTKNLMHRLRPSAGLVEVTGFSFPSTHALAATLFFCLAIFLFKEGIKEKSLRIIFAGTNIMMILAVAFSRVYLNVHWFSDVVAGISLGLFWLTFIILVLRNFIPWFNASEEQEQNGSAFKP